MCLTSVPLMCFGVISSVDVLIRSLGLNLIEHDINYI